MKSPVKGKGGQVLIEFVASVGVALALLAGAGMLFHEEWQRTRCAYAVFEKAHAALIGGLSFASTVPVSLTRGETFVEGQARCGQANERVRLPRLESARW